ncbi:MAG: MutS family DNA mismatch repair protein [Firmicutes bacterium]|nr:MutS family DNA mismatch repair protein [Bacillota bacterium]
MNNVAIRKEYIRRSTFYRKQLAISNKKSRGLSSLRLIVFLSAAVALLYGIYAPWKSIFPLVPILLGVFIYLVLQHAQVHVEIAHLKKMVTINDVAVMRVDGAWTTFADDGAEYIDHSHPYTTDLHIFGKGSLFQFISVPLSFGGQQRLVELLRTQPIFKEIAPRQQAVTELASRLGFRQHMQAAASDSFFRSKNPTGVLSWLEKQRQFTTLPQALLYVPVVTITLFVIASLGYITYAIPLISLAIQALLALWGERLVSQRFAGIDKPLSLLKRYAHVLTLIEEQEFTSAILATQKKRLFAGIVPASRLIQRLVRIVERNDIRYSNTIIYYPLNVSIFWDLWTLHKLDAWQNSWGRDVRAWFEAVAEIEALCCLSGLCYDNPTWVFPQIRNEAPMICAKDVAHPLIPIAERIGNDLSMPQQGRVLMITGSNMSGKSTMLRTVGINLVLAYVGVPVCAREMSCSPMSIYCKMQILDNLNERISTFYAELKRMKMIIDAAKSEEPQLFLLDEIFRGTNSRDRIIATRTVIRQLHALNTIGLVSTHDLELGSLADEFPGTIVNFHFTDEIKDGHITFDYKIKPGISKTANAVALMKMIGID